MNNYRGVLVRLEEDDKQTLGSLTIFNGNDRVFECYVLELPWLDNEPFKSCIPVGKYYVEARLSGRYGRHWHVKELDWNEVRGRSLILMHWGNYHRDTDGCMLTGRDIIDLDKDGHKDVTSSKITMNAMNNAIADTHFILTITDMT